MTSNLKNLVFNLSNKSEILKETDKAIKRVQDILVKKSMSKALQDNKRKELRTLAKELSRIGNEIKDSLEDENLKNDKHIGRQYKLIKETCEYVSISLNSKLDEKSKEEKYMSGKTILDDMKKVLILKAFKPLKILKILQSMHAR